MLGTRLLRLVALGALVAVCSVGFAACSGGNDEGTSKPTTTTAANPGATAPALVGTQWLLRGPSSFRPAPDTVSVTASFDGSRVSGSEGCNTYTGPYTTQGSAMTIGPAIGGTLMACTGDAGAVSAEYQRRLLLVRAYRVSGRQLALTNATGNVVLEYRPAGAADLQGGWEVTGYATGTAIQSPALGTTLTLRFDATTVGGNSGCNTFHGPFTTHGTALHIGPLASTHVACADPAQQTQETQYLAALGAATSYSLGGSVLTLLHADGTIAVTLIAR